MDLNPRHRQPGPSLNAPPLLLDSHCRPLLDPSILYISSYTIYVTTTLLDRLSPPGPTLSTEPSPPSNLSILYIPFYTIYIIAALPNPHRLAPGSSPPPFASTDVLRRPPDFLFFLRSNAVYLSYVAHHLSSILRTIYHATYN